MVDLLDVQSCLTAHRELGIGNWGRKTRFAESRNSAKQVSFSVPKSICPCGILNVKNPTHIVKAK